MSGLLSGKLSNFFNGFASTSNLNSSAAVTQLISKMNFDHVTKSLAFSYSGPVDDEPLTSSLRRLDITWLNIFVVCLAGNDEHLANLITKANPVNKVVVVRLPFTVSEDHYPTDSWKLSLRLLVEAPYLLATFSHITLCADPKISFQSNSLYRIFKEATHARSPYDGFQIANVLPGGPLAFVSNSTNDSSWRALASLRDAVTFFADTPNGPLIQEDFHPFVLRTLGSRSVVTGFSALRIKKDPQSRDWFCT